MLKNVKKMVRNIFSDFIVLDPARIWIDQILWIRIFLRSMRIHITALIMCITT